MLGLGCLRSALWPALSRSRRLLLSGRHAPVWTIIQTCVIVGSVFFATGLIGEQVAVQRSELRELRRRVEEQSAVPND
jgi:hypothetical protein